MAVGGHLIEDRSTEDDLTPLPGWVPGAKAIADGGLVAEEHILHPALTMGAWPLLPAEPSELFHQCDRPIPRGRPRAVARDGRRPGRWDDDCRTPRSRRFVDGDRVIGGVSGDAHEGVRLEFPILSLNPGLRRRCVAPGVWPTTLRSAATRR